MALKRREALLSGVILLVAWVLIFAGVSAVRYLTYGFSLGVLCAVACIALIVLLTPAINSHPSDQLPPRRLALLDESTWSHEVALLSERSKYEPEPLYLPSVAISDALDEILKLALRDFIHSWYGHISRNPVFGNEVDRAVRYSIGCLRDQIFALDLVEVAVSRFVPLFTKHLKEFYDAERTVRGKNLSRNVTESDELDLAIAARYQHGSLHPAASLAYSDTSQLQQDYLRKIVERVLPKLIPPSQAKSRAVTVFVREIVTCAVLGPLMQILSDPDTWNQLMEAYGRTMLQDRKTVRKLREALDQHASPSSKSRPAHAFPKLAPQDSERRYERFIRAARTCSNLSDARRFRNEVSSQLKKDSRVEDQDQVYLRRLELGKRILDHRVLSLASGTSGKSIPLPPLANGSVTSRMENASLTQILRDASGVSYFMEFMDRQKKMPLVQFWIVVDGLRNPLENDIMDSEDSSHLSTQWTEADRNDIAQVYEAYMKRPEMRIPQSSHDVVRSFLKAGAKADAGQYQKARLAVLSAQSSVLSEMQKTDFPKFRLSDLFYKFLSADETTTNSSTLQNLPFLDSSEDSQTSSHQERPKIPPRMSTRPPSRKLFDLKRSSNSASNIRQSSTTADLNEEPRKSLDSLNAPLFDDDSDQDPLSRSIQSVDVDLQATEKDQAPDTKVVQAMEAALNDIVQATPDADEELTRSLFDTPEASVASTRETDSPRDSLDFGPMDLPGPAKYGEKPSIASLGLVNTSSRIGVFSDDDLFPDQENLIQDEYDDLEDDDSREREPQHDIHEAAPGDLGLAEAISSLTTDIDKLVDQDAIVDSLTRKAELTNNVAELRILRKSKASIEREMRRKELQRQQYIVQETENSLYGRSSVSIKSIMVGTSDDGREYALYVIEVHRKAGEQMPAATWAIARRYSEFHDLHQRLRMKYASIRHLDFPRRRVVMKLQRDFLQKRRKALEQYVRELLLLPDVCQDRDLRAFLSQQAIAPAGDLADAQIQHQHIISRFYNSVTDGVEELLGNIPVLDQLSTAGQSLLSAATGQLSTTNASTTLPAAIAADSLSTAEAEKELTAFEDRELEPFVKPICDIFLELFELNRGNNWLRGRAVVVVLHQLLGGTIERKVRENARVFLAQDDAVLKYIALLQETLWPPPNGTFKRDWKPRTAAQKDKTRTEASLMLATLFPDFAGSVVGRANSQAAARRVFAAVNNARLNTHMAFTVLDEIVEILFGK